MELYNRYPLYAGGAAMCTVLFSFAVPFVSLIPSPSSFAFVLLTYSTKQKGKALDILSH